MSNLRFLELLHRDASKLERLTRSVAEHPEDTELFEAFRRVQKRFDKMRADFLQQAQTQHVDVVKYRVINSRSDYSVRSVVDSLSTFQRAFTAIHDCKINGPKEKARFSSEAIEETKLNLGYTYPGSFGFVLALENARDLLDGKLDRSIEVFHDYLRIENSSDAIDCSEEIGLAATSTLFKWVEANASSGNSVDYQWRRSDEKFSGEVVEVDRFEALHDVFIQSVQLEDTIEEFQGVLVGVNLQRGSFHFVTAEDIDIRGKLSSGVLGEKFVVPDNYLAKLRVETNLTPATGEKNTDYTLLALGV